MEIVRINDLRTSELEPYYKLSEPELMHLYEPHGGVFIAETPMIIERAIEAGYEPESMLICEDYIDNATEILQRHGMENTDIPVYVSEEAEISKLTGYKLTRGMLAAMRRKELPGILDVLRDRRRIAVLEDVMNPTNVGAIFRSAAALGVEAILLTSGCSDPLYRRACRVGMGTAFLIPWTYCGDDYIEMLHCHGYKAVAMALRGDSVTIDDPVLRSEPRLAIILGTEGEGLKSETIENADYTVKIPMAAGVDSLNVAAASAVAFWEFTK